MANIQDTSSGKMCRVLSPQTKERTSDVSLKASVTSKMKPYQFLKLINGGKREMSWEIISPLPGEYLTLNTGEFPNEENASSLSQILQAGVPEKYYLSQKACLGILRRASARGKELPVVLKTALEKQAQVV